MRLTLPLITVVALALAILSAPLVADAQQAGKVFRVGIVATTSPVSEMAGPEPVNPAIKAFVHALRDLGYVEGQTLILERRSAEGHFERFGDIVAELVRLKADVIVVAGNDLTQRAKEVTTTVPIVMGTSFNPVESGLVASLARPGGNVTGVSSTVSPEIEGKRLELLKGALPKIRRVAFLGMKPDWESQFGKGAQVSARALRLTLLHAEHASDDYADAFARIVRERPDALLVPQTPSNFGHLRLIVDFATKSRLPGMYPSADYTEAGGLMSYGINVRENWRRAAYFVDRILKGAKPADLPVEQPTKFELVINLKTAKALGLRIPQSLLMRADQVIE